MEVLLSEPIDLELVADLCTVGTKREPAAPRDFSKFHVTNLIESAKLITKGDTRYHEYRGHPSGIMSLGRIWESAMDCYLSHYAVQMGGIYIPDVEQEKDGIIASLDGVLILPELGLLVAETKLRFTSSTEIPARHLQQVRAYCHLAGTDLVCYISGHISSGPPAVQALLRVIRMSQVSIQEIWEMLVKTKEYLEGHGCGPSMFVDFPNRDPVSLSLGGEDVQ